MDDFPKFEPTPFDNEIKEWMEEANRITQQVIYAFMIPSDLFDCEHKFVELVGGRRCRLCGYQQYARYENGVNHYAPTIIDSTENKPDLL